MNTQQSLEAVDDGIFEQLVNHFLEDTVPHLRGLTVTGQNVQGKAVAYPVDGVTIIYDPKPCWVYIASTTISLKSLRGKWLGTTKDVGDITKAGNLFLSRKTDNPNVKGRLYLATNRMLAEDARLFIEAVTKGNGFGFDTKIVEASALLRYLETHREGQYIRQNLLNIPANRLSLPLLRQIGKDSLLQHWQRFGPIWHGTERLIAREAIEKVRPLLAVGYSLVGLQGISGGGKSMLAHQVAQERLRETDIALWLPAEKIVPDAPLSTTLTVLLQSFFPSLEANVGQEGLNLVNEHSCRLVLLVDDINRTGKVPTLIRLIEGWAVSNKDGNTQKTNSRSKNNAALQNVSFLVPLWPNATALDGISAQPSPLSGALWQYVTIGRYSPNEQRMLDSDSIMDTSNFQQVVNALDGDPFLCGLISPRFKYSSDDARSVLIRALFEDFIDHAAKFTEDQARSAGLPITRYDVAQAVDGLIDVMLEQDEPSPNWNRVRERVGDRSIDILHHAATTNQFGWLIDDIKKTVWQWKHTRLRDAMIGRRLAAIAFTETHDNMLTERAKGYLNNPGLSEAWALSLAFQPNNTTQVRMIEALGQYAPLALAHAVRLSIFPEEGGQRQAIRNSLRSALAGDVDRKNEFVPGLRTLILEQFTLTDDELILEITEEMPREWDIEIARIRNGDTKAALRIISRETNHDDFLPGTRFRQIETALEGFATKYISRENFLLDQLQHEYEHDSQVAAIVLLMGYLAWPEFAPMICDFWQERYKAELAQIDDANHFVWLCHLWALGRCCTLETKLVLKELLFLVETLSNNDPINPQDHHNPQRFRLFTQPMGRGFGLRWPISSSAAEAWAEVTAEKPDISRSLFYACRHLEEVVIVEAYVRWYGDNKPLMWGEFTRSMDVLIDPQPLPPGWFHDATVYQNPFVLDRLWLMVQVETDQSIRKLAFEMWKRSASHSELSLLQSIDEEDPLFDTALQVRVRLNDETAAQALATRIRKDPVTWCGYAPRLYQNAEVQEAFLSSYGEALQQNGGDVGDAPIHLPSDAIPNFVQRLKPSLLRAPDTWIPLLMTDVPEALAIVQEALLGADEKDTKYLITFGLTHPLTKKMLEALRPTLHRFSTEDVARLIESAIKSGQGDWVKQHLPNVVSEDHSPRWMTEADLRKNLDELAALVPKGYLAVRYTQGYYNVIDVNPHRATMQDPLTVTRHWLGEHPTDSQITVAGMAVAERGTPSDKEWWCQIVPGPLSIEYWKSAIHLLSIRQWKE